MFFRLQSSSIFYWHIITNINFKVRDLQVLYIPQHIFEYLQQHPKAKNDALINSFNISQATAARYRHGFKKYLNDPINTQIRHTPYQGTPRLINCMSSTIFNSFLLEVLDQGGFQSTAELRKMFFEKYCQYRHYTHRTFNRYFKQARTELRDILVKHPLEIISSSNIKIGFQTIPRKKGPSD